MIPAGMTPESGTLPEPDLRPVPGRSGRWRLHEAYVYQDGPTRLTVPEGFETNLASVPRAAWVVINRDECGEVAPLVHDFLYGCGGCPGESAVPWRTYSRAEADEIFRRIMAAQGIPAWRRRVAYLAVRTFGASHWRAP